MHTTRQKVVNMTILSGCLAIQNKVYCYVKEEDLFQNVIKAEVAKSSDIHIQNNIIHYLTPEEVKKRLEVRNKTLPIDVIVFVVRPNLYLKVLATNTAIPQRDKPTSAPLPDQQQPHLMQAWARGRRAIVTFLKQNAILYKVSVFVRSCFHTIKHLYVYTLGSLAGNSKNAESLFTDSLEYLVDYSSSNTMQLIVVGPISSIRSVVENAIVKRLNRKLKHMATSYGTTYIDITGTHTSDGIYKFIRGDFHFNEHGHKEIAQKILAQFNFTELFNAVPAPVSVTTEDNI